VQGSDVLGFSPSVHLRYNYNYYYIYYYYYYDYYYNYNIPGGCVIDKRGAGQCCAGV